MYESNRNYSVKPVKLTKELKDKILHYLKQKYSPEMMIKAKGIAASISTIYYWNHLGHLGVTTKALLYPRKKKMMRRRASPDFKPMGKSIEERPEIERFGDMEIDTVIQTRAKNECLLILTDRKSHYQLIGLILDKTAISVNHALKGILKDYQVYSITADNKTEFSRLSEVFAPQHIY